MASWLHASHSRRARPRRVDDNILILCSRAAGVRSQTRVRDQVVERVPPRAPQVVRHVVRAVAIARAVPRSRDERHGMSIVQSSWTRPFALTQIRHDVAVATKPSFRSNIQAWSASLRSPVAYFASSGRSRPSTIPSLPASKHRAAEAASF